MLALTFNTKMLLLTMAARVVFPISEIDYTDPVAFTVMKHFEMVMLALLYAETEKKGALATSEAFSLKF